MSCKKSLIEKGVLMGVPWASAARSLGPCYKNPIGGLINRYFPPSNTRVSFPEADRAAFGVNSPKANSNTPPSCSMALNQKVDCSPL